MPWASACGAAACERGAVSSRADGTSRSDTIPLVARSERTPKAVSTPGVRAGLAKLQVAVRNVLAGVPGLPGTRPVEIAAALGIDLKLAWKVARIAQSGDPFGAVRHLPGSAGWRIAMEAAERAGAAAAVVAEATAAFERATASGAAWAGDRRAFEMMAAGLAAGSDMRIDVEHRRQLYLGGSYVWGVRARLAIRIDILGPARTSKRMLDCVTVRGFLGVERMRSDAAWRIEAPFVLDDRGSKRVAAPAEPLVPTPRGDDAGPAAGPHLLRDFCSGGLPELRPMAEAGAPRSLELADSEVGTEGRFDIVHGTVLRNVQSLRRSSRHHGIFQMFQQRTPAERAVFDLAVHRSAIPEDALPEGILYSDVHARTPTSHHRAKDRIPAGTAVAALGAGLRKARLPDMPRHAELLKLGFERAGWNPAEFLLFRVDVSYPPVPSTLALELPLHD